MKPSPSPPASSPSLYGGRGGRATSNCLSRILRRILRLSNLPSCPFDRHFKVEEGESPLAIGAPDATPGVVARLMGLDSVPPAEPIKSSCPPRARRAHDMPPYRELQDEKFFVLSFEKRHVSCAGETKPNSRRIANSNNPSERSKKKLAKKDFLEEVNSLEYEGDSEHSSPNSVLEFERFSADQQFLSLGEISRPENTRTRRPLSEVLEHCGGSKGKVAVEFGGENIVRSEKKQRNFAVKSGKIGKFAATEAKGMDEELVLRNKHCLLELGGDVASTIFDHLLEELVLILIQY